MAKNSYGVCMHVCVDRSKCTCVVSVCNVQFAKKKNDNFFYVWLNSQKQSKLLCTIENVTVGTRLVPFTFAPNNHHQLGITSNLYLR